MFAIIKEWRENPISLPKIESYMRENYPTYIGNQAHSVLELYFSEELIAEEIEAINSFYESLEEIDYISLEMLENMEKELQLAIDVMKINLVLKSWDEMSVVERKIAVGLKPTREEMGL